MIPILYESNETAFAGNGLGRLRDCLTCTVTEERNGVYECNFEYPITGQNYNKIKLGRIIAVEHDDTNDIQPFDIVNCSRPIDGVVTFHCVHISYRQSYMTVSGTSISSLSAAFTALGSAVPSNPFTYSTDKASTGYVAAFDGIPRTVRSILGGTEGSILDAYGGEYEFDKWNVILHSARGTNRNLTIRYGVNMLDYEEDIDYSSSYTAVVPYWNGTEKVVGNMVSSGQSPYNGIEACVPLDLTEKFETKPTAAQLRSMASSMMTTNQNYMPSQSIKVDFIRLQDSDEYAHLAPLLSCRLCDTVNVVMPRYNMSGKFKIVKTVYNVLLDKFDGMELGTLSTTLSEALGIISSSSFGSSSSSSGGTDVKLLWSGGGWVMHSGQTVTLSENISDQAHGIVMLWSRRQNGTTYDDSWNSQFIPKYFISVQNGKNFTFVGSATTTALTISKKTVYIYDNRIVGVDWNDDTATNMNNALLVLRYVVGV